MQVGVRARKNSWLNHPEIREVIKSRPQETHPGVLKEVSGAAAEKLALNYFQRVGQEKGNVENQKKGAESRTLNREGRRWRVGPGWAAALLGVFINTQRVTQG